MRRLYWRLLAVLTMALIPAILFGVVVARAGGAGLAAMYPFYAPYTDSLSYLYADVNRGLVLVKTEPVHLSVLYNATTSPDRKLRVRSIPDPDSPEIFITENSEPVVQLTYIGKPPPVQGLNRRVNILPAWSPDGEWILFLSTAASGRFELFAIRPDGDDLRLLSVRVRIRTTLRPRWVEIG